MKTVNYSLTLRNLIQLIMIMNWMERKKFSEEDFVWREKWDKLFSRSVGFDRTIRRFYNLRHIIKIIKFLYFLKRKNRNLNLK